VNDSGPVLASSKEAKALQLLAREELTSRAERDSAIRELVQSTEGALALVARMHRGAMTQQDLQAAVAMGRAVSTSDIRGLFENFVPESERRATLGSQIDPATILGKTGNHARGKLIFFSDAARCRACHEINDANKSLGPSIVEINKKYPRQSELLQHVLQPSLKIDEQFVGYTIVTHGGRVITGLLVDKSDSEVVIKTVERHVVRIAANDIDEMKKSTKSLMPDFLLSDLTAQEAADLLRYIQSHGADAKP